MDVDDAVELIAHAVAQPSFQTTPESQKAMETLLLAAQVQAALVHEIPSVKAGVEGGEVVVTIGGAWDGDEKLLAKVEQVSDNVGGVKVKVRLIRP